VSLEGARERQRRERREERGERVFFYIYNIDLDRYSGALYIRLYCSV
jgi:hypothetical protein